MKIFLDVGGHEGQTLSAILEPKYEFDRIYVFEPVKSLHINLKKVAEKRQNITLLEYGLWKKNATQKVYSPGTLAGSIFATHQDVEQNDFVPCQFVNASEWFDKNISQEDELYVKLNCEGAEADILLNLLDSKEIFKIKNVMIDFDVRKVKGLEAAQNEILDKFENAYFKNYSICEDVMHGPTHALRIQNWLDGAGAGKTDMLSTTTQFFHWLKRTISGNRPGYRWEIKHFLKSHTPLFLLKFLRARRS